MKNNIVFNNVYENSFFTGYKKALKNLPFCLLVIGSLAKGEDLTHFHSKYMADWFAEQDSTTNKNYYDLYNGMLTEKPFPVKPEVLNGVTLNTYMGETSDKLIKDAVFRYEHNASSMMLKTDVAPHVPAFIEIYKQKYKDLPKTIIPIFFIVEQDWANLPGGKALIDTMIKNGLSVDTKGPGYKETIVDQIISQQKGQSYDQPSSNGSTLTYICQNPQLHNTPECIKWNKYLLELFYADKNALIGLGKWRGQDPKIRIDQSVPIEPYWVVSNPIAMKEPMLPFYVVFNNWAGSPESRTALDKIIAFSGFDLGYKVRGDYIKNTIPTSLTNPTVIDLAIEAKSADASVLSYSTITYMCNQPSLSNHPECNKWHKFLDPKFISQAEIQTLKTNVANKVPFILEPYQVNVAVGDSFKQTPIFYAAFNNWTDQKALDAMINAGLNLDHKADYSSLPRTKTALTQATVVDVVIEGKIWPKDTGKATLTYTCKNPQMAVQPECEKWNNFVMGSVTPSVFSITYNETQASSMHEGVYTRSTWLINNDPKLAYTPSQPVTKLICLRWSPDGRLVMDNNCFDQVFIEASTGEVFDPKNQGRLAWEAEMTKGFKSAEPLISQDTGDMMRLDQLEWRMPNIYQDGDIVVALNSTHGGKTVWYEKEGNTMSSLGSNGEISTMYQQGLKNLKVKFNGPPDTKFSWWFDSEPSIANADKLDEFNGVMCFKKTATGQLEPIGLDKCFGPPELWSQITQKKVEPGMISYASFDAHGSSYLSSIRTAFGGMKPLFDEPFTQKLQDAKAYVRFDVKPRDKPIMIGLATENWVYLYPTMSELEHSQFPDNFSNGVGSITYNRKWSVDWLETTNNSQPSLPFNKTSNLNSAPIPDPVVTILCWEMLPDKQFKLVPTQECLQAMKILDVADDIPSEKFAGDTRDAINAFDVFLRAKVAANKPLFNQESAEKMASENKVVEYVLNPFDNPVVAILLSDKHTSYFPGKSWKPGDKGAERIRVAFKKSPTGQHTEQVWSGRTEDDPQHSVTLPDPVKDDLNDISYDFRLPPIYSDPEDLVKEIVCFEMLPSGDLAPIANCMGEAHWKVTIN